MSAARSAAIVGNAITNERTTRAIGLCLAAIAWKGDPTDVGGIIGLADDFVQYLEGDDAAPIPRPDKLGSVIK